MLSKEVGPPRTSQNFADSLKGIEHKFELLFKQERKLRKAWIKCKCPFKIGETLIGNDYSFEGREFVVNEISITDKYTNAVEYQYNWKWIAAGPILNKNGTTSKRLTRRTIAVADIRIER